MSAATGGTWAKRIFARVLLTDELAERRRQLAEQPEAERAAFRRARAALEVAQRALDPIEPFQNDDVAVVALEIVQYGLTEIWAARLALPAGTSQAEVSEMAQRRLAVSLPEAVARSLATGPAQLSSVEARRVATLARTTLSEQLQQGDRAAPVARVQDLSARRKLRLLLAGSALIALASMAGWRILRGPNLLRRMPSQLSSEWVKCDTKIGICAGVPTDILFHTKEEDQPWVAYDMGQPRSFSRAVVDNRSDCCGDRALPLAVEMSDDGVKYREIARTNEAFSRVTLRFEPVVARFFRLRVKKRSMLHLEGVELYR